MIQIHFEATTGVVSIDARAPAVMADAAKKEKIAAAKKKVSQCIILTLDLIIRAARVT